MNTASIFSRVPLIYSISGIQSHDEMASVSLCTSSYQVKWKVTFHIQPVFYFIMPWVQSGFLFSESEEKNDHGSWTLRASKKQDGDTAL